MTEEQKAEIYGQLLSHHTRLHNQINEVKSQNIDLNKKQLQEIKYLENQQLQIMRKINQLLSR